MPDPLVSAVELRKSFHVVASGFGKGGLFPAVDGVSFEIGEGEILGLVGESGSGKTTVGRILLGVEKPDSGTVLVNGKSVYSLKGREKMEFRKNAQLVFQDPFAALPPHLRVESIVAEPLKIHHLDGGAEATRRAVEEVLTAVALTPAEFSAKRPSELSGGQRQRVAIARALVLKPKFIVADEPVSMLDVSVRVGILNLLLDMRRKQDLSILFITHDLGVAAYTCDRLAVMKEGKIVETGTTRDVLLSPREQYTQTLIEAIPLIKGV
jgi:ABC-type oligopeptide transport system ATPase subunit